MDLTYRPLILRFSHQFDNNHGRILILINYVKTENLHTATVWNVLNEIIYKKCVKVG